MFYNNLGNKQMIEAFVTYDPRNFFLVQISLYGLMEPKKESKAVSHLIKH